MSLLRESMNLRKVLSAFVLFGASFLLLWFLWFLRFYGIIGSLANVLMSWLAIIGSILFGVFIGIAATEKRIGIKRIVVNLLLGLTVLFLSPMIGIATALAIRNALSLNLQFMIVVSATVSGCFGVFFIWFVYWLRRKGHLKYTEIDWSQSFIPHRQILKTDFCFSRHSLLPCGCQYRLKP
jgi:hypothetical protein